LKTTLLALCLLACAATVAVAARDDGKKGGKHPDLSGTWTLDRSKSDFGVFWDRPLAKTDATLVVLHREPELKVTRTLRLNGREETKELVYYTDGRGESNPAAIGGGTADSKTNWERDSIVARAKLSRPGAKGRVEVELIETWRMSGDRKTLTHTAVMKGAFGEEEVRLVYRRAG